MLGLSLRARVLAIFSLIMALAIAASAFALLSNAREAVRAETSAGLALAKRFTIAAINSVTQTHEVDTVLSDLPVHLPQPRHVRITVLDLQGNPIGAEIATVEVDDLEGSPAPRWFYNWIAPPTEIVRIPVVKNARPLGHAVITTIPRDEIAEIWADFATLVTIIVPGCLSVLIGLYWAVGRALHPLKKISESLRDLEKGNYAVQLPDIDVPDLKHIGLRINALSAELARTTKEKNALNHKLMTVQDNERKNIAHELHDEFGPCLFGINVDANFIKTNAREQLNGQGEEIAERADAILKIVDHIQEHNRALLHRLRPMAIGHFGLSHLLGRLVQEFANRYLDKQWTLEVADALTSGGESFDLTIFRMVQECLTNAARHSDARHVAVQVELEPTSSGEADAIVNVVVSDDGNGIDTSRPFGIGISGMQHRISALGGKFSIQHNDPMGTIVSAHIPYSAHKVLGGSIDLSSAQGKLEGA